jgi:hypothetical protein
VEWKTIERERRVGIEPADTQTEILYSLDVPEEDWTQLESAMVEFWVQFCEAVSKEYADRFDEIEAINFIFRPDSGMLYAQPRLQVRRPVLKERTSAIAHCLLVERLYFALPDCDKDAASFDTAHDQLMTQWIETVRAAARKSAATAPIASLEQKHPVKIYGFHYSSDDKETEFELL